MLVVSSPIFVEDTQKKFSIIISEMKIYSETDIRQIFETQIHIQIYIRYFKSLPIATYYLTTVHIKNLYLYSKTYNMGLK